MPFFIFDFIYFLAPPLIIVLWQPGKIFKRLGKKNHLIFLKNYTKDTRWLFAFRLSLTATELKTLFNLKFFVLNALYLNLKTKSILNNFTSFNKMLARWKTYCNSKTLIKLNGIKFLKKENLSFWNWKLLNVNIF